MRSQSHLSPRCDLNRTEAQQGGTATGNDKSDQESAKTNKSDAADNEKEIIKQNLKAIKTKKRKRY